jgi:hypothetical protein
MLSKRNVILSLFAFCLCASSFAGIYDDAPVKPGPDQALVVFLRPSNYGARNWAALYDTQGENKNEFLGLLYGNQKIAAVLPAGDRVLMVNSKETLDFLKAKLEAGKTYHVIVRPRMGAFGARFSMTAVHKADVETDQHKDYYAQCRWVGKMDNIKPHERDMWVSRSARRLEARRKEGYDRWLTGDEASAPHRNLAPEDGF